MTAPANNEPDGLADAAERKLFETVRATAALSGVQVYRLDGGAYLLQRWNMHRELPSLDDARELLLRMGISA